MHWQTGALCTIALAAIQVAANNDNSTELFPRGIRSSPLECFQVSHPVVTPRGLARGRKLVGKPYNLFMPFCQTKLMEHEFNGGARDPFVVSYVPPIGCEFNQAVMNLTIVSSGNHHERLGSMYLGNREIWRTSTVQPKEAPGVTSSHWKDVTQYLSLWKEDQEFRFVLGSTAEKAWTGSYKVFAKIIFYQRDSVPWTETLPAADHIIGMTAQTDTEFPRPFMIPQEKAEQLILVPRNTKRAVFTITATALGKEEFWWTNVPQSVSEAYNITTTPLPGYGAYREIRLLIDDKIAGLILPPPVVLAGGVIPPLSRPIVGNQAFDLPEFEIDVTPWLGHLCKGKSHKFSIEVWAVDDTRVVDTASGTPQFVPAPAHWNITGKLFMWLDQVNHFTTGEYPRIRLSQLTYETEYHTYFQGKNDPKVLAGLPEVDLPSNSGPRMHRRARGSRLTLSHPRAVTTYNQTATRRIHIRGAINTTEGVLRSVWRQNLKAHNHGVISEVGFRHKTSTNLMTESWADRGKRNLYYHGARHTPRFHVIQKAPGDFFSGGRYNVSTEAFLRLASEVNVAGHPIPASGMEAYEWYRQPKQGAETIHPAFHGVVISSVIEGKAIYHRLNSSISLGHGKTRQEYQMGVKTVNQPQLRPGFDPEYVLYTRNVMAEHDIVTYDNEYSAKSWGDYQPNSHLPIKKLGSLGKVQFYYPISQALEGFVEEKPRPEDGDV